MDFLRAGRMIVVCYWSYFKEVMHFSSILSLVCWPSNPSGEGKPRRNVPCSPQIWFWFTAMCCKRLQSQQMSSMMNLTTKHHGPIYQILPSIPSQTSHGSPSLSYRNRSRRLCHDSKGQGVRWKILCPNCEALRRAFGGTRKHSSNAEVLCRSWEPENNGTARPSDPAGSRYTMEIEIRWRVTALELMVAEPQGPALSITELLLLAPLVKVVQAMTAILRAAKRKSNQGRNPLRQPSLLNSLASYQQLFNPAVKPASPITINHHLSRLRISILWENIIVNG